ncbi:Uma2 family endonuclease [Crocosphaera sp. XPORK-15E]|uniref:Uma2 family endonuclease n=1 Tax=Crocosphaera sp. XPORK-15E TaxID=3110247 RepID=UPI002B1FAE37|nr:Uma2 family endonuclease [Crocosphaera sp. XPORK-15E]MEA5535780.1 Uma2 family endonuclease [Crocosphaera sp. XPORK-15E]
MTVTVANTVNWTIADLEGLPENSNRYEIIDGELFVTRAPHLDHQDIAGNIYAELRTWSRKKGLGKAFITPGIIFSETDAVIPDIIWISNEKLIKFTDSSGHLTAAPELIIEVLSTSEKDIKRDRQTKLKLYSIQGVSEYWIADRQQQLIEVYRRDQGILKKVMTLYSSDQLISPLLPDFSCQIIELF